MKRSNFQTLLRNYCDWWSRPGLSADSWGCCMEAAFVVADYMASQFSEYPMGYRPGLGGAGSIIDEDDNAGKAAFLDTLSRSELRTLAATIDRYRTMLEQAGRDY